MWEKVQSCSTVIYSISCPGYAMSVLIRNVLMEEFISDEDFLREFEDIELATDFVHAVSKLIERDN